MEDNNDKQVENISQGNINSQPDVPVENKQQISQQQPYSASQNTDQSMPISSQQAQSYTDSATSIPTIKTNRPPLKLIVVISILLALSITCVLYFLSYNNIPQAISFPKSLTDPKYNTGLTIGYPTDWTYEHSEDRQYLGGDAWLLTSPDENFTVAINIGVSNMVWPTATACMSESNDARKVTLIDEASVPDYPSAMFVFYAVPSKYFNYSDISAYYELYIGLVTNTDQTKTYLHDGQKNSACLSTNIIINATKGTVGDDMSASNLTSIPLFMLVMSEKNAAYDKYKTIEDIQAVTKTDNYKTAKEIIKSLHVQ